MTARHRLFRRRLLLASEMSGPLRRSVYHSIVSAFQVRGPPGPRSPPTRSEVPDVTLALDLAVTRSRLLDGVIDSQD
jgi:hypothetical protein